MAGDNDDSQGSSGRAVAVWTFVTSTASKLTGGMVGVAVTSATANPFLGVATATTLAQALEKGGAYVVHLMIGPRQKIRAGRAIEVAAVRMQDRIINGEVVRTDLFVEPRPDGRSDADEVVESVLQASINSAEEKKVDFLAAMMTSVFMDSSIRAADAQQMIEIAQGLRYRSLIVLKITNNVHVHRWPARGGDKVPGPPARLYPLMAQIYDLCRQGLIEMKDRLEDRDVYLVAAAGDIDPAKLHLSPLGRSLYEIMELKRLSEADPTYVETLADLGALSGYGQGHSGQF